MSSVEDNTNDILPFVYAGAIGLVTLGIASYLCLRNNNKKTGEDTNQENELNKKEESKMFEVIKDPKKKKIKKNKLKEDEKKEEENNVEEKSLEKKEEKIEEENTPIIPLSKKVEEESVKKVEDLKLKTKKKNKNPKKEKKPQKKEEDKKVFDYVIEDDRDGGWETVTTKKEDKSKREEKRLEQEKSEKLYNDYLNQF